MKQENIYGAEKDVTDEFSEDKVFANSYFYKTHIRWNYLPHELKTIEDYNKFKTKLEEYFWESILECDKSMDQSCTSSDLSVNQYSI